MVPSGEEGRSPGFVSGAVLLICGLAGFSTGSLLKRFLPTANGTHKAVATAAGAAVVSAGFFPRRPVSLVIYALSGFGLATILDSVVHLVSVVDDRFSLHTGV